MEGDSVDHDDGFDTDEWDSSDNSDETLTKHQHHNDHSHITQPVVRVLNGWLMNVVVEYLLVFSLFLTQ